MTISRVTRVSNPRRRRRATSSKRRNPKRRLSLKQKLHFGSARQRAAAKAALRKKKSNPKRKAHRRRTAPVVRRRRRVARANPVRRRRRARRSNPAHMITLGLVNPRPKRRRRTASKRRAKSNMAKTKRRNTRRRRASANPRRRRRNSVKVIVRRRNRRRTYAANPRRRRRHHYRANPRRHTRRYRRNPSLFGRSVNAVEMAKAVAGGLAGVAITKALPNMLPLGMLPTSPLTNTLVSAAVAFAAGLAVKALIKSDPTIGDAVMFGGFMQAGSVALNSFLPQVGTVIGLHGLGNGMGDIVPGRFTVPQNPILAGQQMVALPPAPVKAGVSGVGAIYSPFGRAM